MSELATTRRRSRSIATSRSIAKSRCRSAAAEDAARVSSAPALLENISRSERHVLHMPAHGGRIHHGRDGGRIVEVLRFTRDGRTPADCALEACAALRRERIVGSKSSGPVGAPTKADASCSPGPATATKAPPSRLRHEMSRYRTRAKECDAGAKGSNGNVGGCLYPLRVISKPGDRRRRLRWPQDRRDDGWIPHLRRRFAGFRVPRPHPPRRGRSAGRSRRPHPRRTPDP